MRYAVAGYGVLSWVIGGVTRRTRISGPARVAGAAGHDYRSARFQSNGAGDDDAVLRVPGAHADLADLEVAGGRPGDGRREVGWEAAELEQRGAPARAREPLGDVLEHARTARGCSTRPRGDRRSRGRSAQASAISSG